MKLSTLKKLGSWTWRQRERAYRLLECEPNTAMNFERPRLRGEIRAFEKTHDRIQALLKSEHDRWLSRATSTKPPAGKEEM